MSRFNLKGFFTGILITLLVVIFAGGAVFVDKAKNKIELLFKPQSTVTQKVVEEESMVIDIADKTSQSVVTVSIKTPSRRVLQFSPFGGLQESIQGGQDQDIGSGFVASKDGLIVTNKHVVADTSATYKVIDKDGKEYDAKQISRDPNNDIAVIKIDDNNLKPLELGDSDHLKVGQFVMAVGTALGEFRHTVTTGIVSGLGRGITAGDNYQGYVERLDNVIQTDAAINPGNSGGPLVNSSGQAIGINVAVASGAQNIAFAIPINVVKEALNQLNDNNGSFPAKPFLGVRYQMIPKRSALLNEVPEGALIAEVVDGSPAQKAGLEVDDIVVSMDDTQINESHDLGEFISTKKVGDKIKIEYYRGDEKKTTEVTLEASES